MQARLSNVLAIVTSIASYLSAAAAKAPELAAKLPSVMGTAAKILDGATGFVTMFFPQVAPFLAEMKVGLNLVATYGPEIATDLEHVAGLLGSIDFSKLTPATDPPPEPPKT